MNDEIKEAIPPRARKVIYLIFAVLSVAAGACQVGYAAAELPQPIWLTVAMAVLAFLGSTLGVTAYANTPHTVVPVAQVADADSVADAGSGADYSSAEYAGDYTDPAYARS